jgi:branched-subunit amino acid ABC-type transport system permease component
MSLFLQAIGFGLVSAAILALGAVGFTVQFGVTNVFNLAYGDLMTCGAFVGYFVTQHHFSVWVGMLAAAVAVALASVALNRALYAPLLRRGTGLFAMVIVTISMGLIIQNLLLAWLGSGIFSYPILAGGTHHFAGMVFTATQLWLIAVAIAAMVVFHGLLRFTKLGRAMRAVAADKTLARSSGVPVSRITDFAWLLSGALCGIAGVALVMNISTLTVTTGSGFLVVMIAAAAVGGVGQPYGAMLGAVVVGIVSSVAASYLNPVYEQLSAFVLLGLVLLIRPSGIVRTLAVDRAVA